MGVGGRGWWVGGRGWWVGGSGWACTGANDPPWYEGSVTNTPSTQQAPLATIFVAAALRSPCPEQTTRSSRMAALAAPLDPRRALLFQNLGNQSNGHQICRESEITQIGNQVNLTDILTGTYQRTRQGGSVHARTPLCLAGVRRYTLATAVLRLDTVLVDAPRVLERVVHVVIPGGVVHPRRRVVSGALREPRGVVRGMAGAARRAFSPELSTHQRSGPTRPSSPIVVDGQISSNRAPSGGVCARHSAWPVRVVTVPPVA